MATQLRVTVWNEYRHEWRAGRVAEVYPEGMHAPIAKSLREQGMSVRTATLDEPEHGLSEAVLAETDVLTWWGHLAHREVSDTIVDRVQRRVLEGMGLVVLHSGHESKIFQRLMGTTCGLRWREYGEDGERERIWVIEPGHPIAAGLGEYFEVPRSEMYGEHFDIPAPDTLVFVNWYQGGEVFRGGCCFTRGQGHIFYFSPGHETFPIYYQKEVLQVIGNAVRWAAPTNAEKMRLGSLGRPEPLEPIK